MTFLPMAPPKQPSQALYLAASSTPFATLLFCHGRLVITHVFSLGWTAYFSSWSLIWLRGEQKWHLDLLAFCRLQVSFCLKTPQNTLPKRAFQSPSPSSLITHYSVCTANTTANIYIYTNCIQLLAIRLLARSSSWLRYIEAGTLCNYNLPPSRSSAFQKQRHNKTGNTPTSVVPISVTQSTVRNTG